MADIYCSTGVFVGRPNGRDHRLIIKYGSEIRCDGFELMLYDTWRENLEQIISELCALKLRFPVLHSDKQIGDMLSAPDTDIGTLLALWQENCGAARAVGAGKVVVHPWGIPDSDKHFELITERLALMLECARKADVTMMAENCLCLNGSPIENLEKLAQSIPELSFILDTRAAQFHSELMRTAQSELVGSGRVHHIHAIDYAGGHMDFEQRLKVPDPGMGDVDFDGFFSALAQGGYRDTVTLESSMQIPDTVNVDRVNSALDYVRSAASVLS